MSFRLKLFVVLCVLVAVVTLSACSFATHFVVTNESNDRIQIRYVLKKPPIPDAPPRTPEAPAVKLISELGTNVEWRDLPATRFTFAPETRTLVVTLMPNEALRVERQTDVSCAEKDPRRLEDFPIEEINIIGPTGALRLTGDQARKSFVSDKRNICVLTYR